MGAIVDIEREAIQSERSAPVPSGVPGVEILDANALWAELEEPRFIVDPICRTGSVTLLNAYAASGKSWLGTDLVISVATGLPWLERFPTEQGSTLYIDHEAGKYEMRRRLQAISKARGLVGPVQGVNVTTHPNLFMTHAKYEEHVTRLMADHRVLVVDTLKAANPGTDENDSNMRVGLDALHRVAERLDCAVVVLTHAKKMGGNQNQIDLREAGRGSSAIFDAADSVLHMVYEKNKPLKVLQTKARMGRAVDPFEVHIDDTPTGGVRVWACDVAPEADAKTNFGSACQKVLALVRSNRGASTRVIREQATMAPATVAAALDQLEADGRIKNEGTPGRMRWVATP